MPGAKPRGYPVRAFMNKPIENLISRAGSIILDKEEQIKLALACFLAKGHLLIEDIPGIGKTTLAQTLARLMNLDFQRIQCTNDLLPGDILGVSVYEKNPGRFVFHPGPVFAQAVLVDEINRAAPKTQSGLLEVMAEGQVTLDRERHVLPSPFFVMATQNPQEQAGTYPLPESQLDRFLMCISLGYPGRAAEIELLKGRDRKELLSSLSSSLTPAESLRFREDVRKIHAAEPVLNYIRDILEYSREQHSFLTGLSPRAGLDLLHCAKSWAYIHSRDFLLPEDVQAVFSAVTGHRLQLKQDLSSGDKTTELTSLLHNVPIP